MRRMRAAGCVEYKEWLVRCDGRESLQPIDGIDGHCRGQVPAPLANVGIDRSGITKQVRLPLAGIASQKAIKILEAQAGRPLVERSDLTCLELGRDVVLAEP